jgi:hypothetical protein
MQHRACTDPANLDEGRCQHKPSSTKKKRQPGDPGCREEAYGYATVVWGPSRVSSAAALVSLPVLRLQDLWG